MRVKQYPHYLFIEDATESYQDELGNWVVSETSCKFISMCREETNGKGTELKIAGGDFIKASSLVQCPTTCPIVENGTKIIVADDPDCHNVRISGVSLKFDKGQLHSRLWV